MQVSLNNVLLTLNEGDRVIDALKAYYVSQALDMPDLMPSVSDAYYHKYPHDRKLTNNATLFISRLRGKKSKKISE